MAVKAKQYRRKGAYVRRFEEMLNSPAYRDLKPAARCLLEELQRRYRPGRNGRIGLGVREAADLVNINRDTASRCFRELSEHGFIRMAQGALYRQGRAREWWLTFEPRDHNGEPTDEWLRWKKGEPVFKLP